MTPQTAPTIARLTGHWVPVVFAVFLVLLSVSAVATSNRLWVTDPDQAMAVSSESR